MADSVTSTATVALTSVFTPPSGCQNSWTYEGQYYNSISGGLLMQNMWLTNAPLTCFPPYWNSEGRVPKGISYIYSPAACPAGYTSAQQVITGSGSGANTAA
ncbi:hypothetical protein H2198_010368, partial [Neophaeococcomyces mojaviensis]